MMTMQVARELPPLFDVIDAAFHVADQPVIFAWGRTIFNPKGIMVTPELFAHEAVHGQRQGANPEKWWRSYISDPEFRIAEEIPAHAAEYAKFCQTHADRNQRALALHKIALRLSGSLYGGLIDYPGARAAIKQ